MIEITTISNFRHWLTVAFFAVLAFGFYVGISTGDDAMTQCEKTYSHDACFQALNR